MPDAVPHSLKEAIRLGSCIPFVGAGVSMSVLDKNRRALFPSWSELALRLASHLDQEQKQPEAKLVRALVEINPPRLLEAAREAQAALGSVWYRALGAAFNPSREVIEESTLTLPKLIWELGSSLVVTTNYDKVLSWACPDSSNLETWEIESRGEMASALAAQRRPTVWHLHGHIQNAADLILTPDGYELLYGAERSAPRYDAALHTLRQLLASRTFLFVGFSGEDENPGLYRSTHSTDGNARCWFNALVYRIRVSDDLRSRSIGECHLPSPL